MPRPTTRPPAPLSPAAGRFDRSRLGELRVLVADDNATVTALLARMLARLGARAITVADGQQAVTELRSTPFDVILLDLSMPVRSGLDVLRWLRERPALPGPVPHVVVMSASAFDERPALASLGVTHLLPKPFRLEELASALHVGVSAS